MTTAEVVRDMLSRIPGPYAICLSYHPDLEIRGTLHKYGSKVMVKDYAACIRQAYTLAGYADEAAAVKVINATEEEIVRCLEYTGSVAKLYEEKENCIPSSTALCRDGARKPGGHHSVAG